MLHPSYSDLMEVVNNEVEEGEDKVVNSRYSIVIATAKRARQIILGEEALVSSNNKKPLSIAVEELAESKINILPEGYVFEEPEIKNPQFSEEDIINIDDEDIEHDDILEDE